MTLTAAGLVEKRTLGSLAFSSATFDNYQGWQLNGGTSTEAIGKNETVTFTGSGGTAVSNSGNTVTITSTDTNTTNFNIQANAGTSENISAGETINFTGSGGVSVTRAGNSFTIDGSSAGITDVVSDTTPQLGGQLDANGNTILMGTNTITDAKVGQWDVAYGDKVNTVAFDTGTGILTLNRQDGGTVTKDLDGRYPLNDGTGATGTWGISISGNAATATSASAAPFNGLTGKTSGTGTYESTGAFSAPTMIADKISVRSGTQLVLNAGESDQYDSGQTAEAIYLNAESGVQVVSSPDNWVSGWAGRKTAVINDSSGNSSFPGNITLTGTVDGRDVAADGTKLDGIAAGATNTAAPAITSNGSTPSLASGITAAEVRSLIGAGTSSTTGTVTSVSGANGISGTVTTSGSLTLDSDLRSHVWQMGRDTNDYFIVNTTTQSWFLDGTEEMRLSNTGQLDVDGNVVAFSTAISDERLKDNVETIANPLDTVSALRGVTFEWNKGHRKGQKDIGVIAQEVQAVLPELIVEAKDSLIDGEDYLTVSYGQMAGLFIECFKEVISRLEALENK